MKGVVEVSELGAGAFRWDKVSLNRNISVCLASLSILVTSHFDPWLWPVSIVNAAAVLQSRFVGHTGLRWHYLSSTLATKPEGSLRSSMPSPRSPFADSTSTTNRIRSFYSMARVFKVECGTIPFKRHSGCLSSRLTLCPPQCHDPCCLYSGHH